MTSISLKQSELADVLEALKGLQAGVHSAPLATSQDPVLGPIVDSLNLAMKGLQERERKVHENETLLRSIFHRLPLMVAYYDANLQNIESNFAYGRFFAKANYVRGRQMEDIVGSEYFQTVREKVQGVLAGHAQTFEREFLQETSDTVQKMLLRYIPDLQGGTVIGFFVVVTDVTSLRETEAASRFLLDSLKIGTWRLDLKTQQLHWDQSMYEVFGVRAENFSGHYQAWESCLTAEAKANAVAAVEAASLGGQDLNLIFEINHPAKGVRSIAGRGQVMRDSSGTARMMYGINYDVTEEVEGRREKERLRESLQRALDETQANEKRFRSLFENISVGITVIDEAGYFLMSNLALQKMLGYTEEELTKLTVSQITHPDELADTAERLREFSRTGILHFVEKRCLHKSGRVVWFRVTSRAIVGLYNVKTRFSVIEDITEARLREGERLLLRKERDLFLEAANFMILRVDLEGKLTAASAEVTRVLGYEPSELVGKPPTVLHDPEEVEAAVEAMSRRVGRSVTAIEMFHEPVDRGLAAERQWNYVRKDGTKVPVLLSISGLKDENGKMYGYLGFARDLTETIRARADLEVERLKSLNSSRLASLGEMAGGVAHEINNPLAIISAVGSQLGELLEEPEIDRVAALEMTNSINKTVHRIAKIIQGLRTFSREGGSDPFLPVSVASVVSETASFCQERLRNHGIEFRIEAIPAGLCFLGRATQISQVLLNLLNNAHDAIVERPEKWISVEARQAGDCIEIRVTDSGPGIPEETQRKIFQPFFTTKDIGKGTGMGLSISLGIAKNHGGELTLDSRSGHTCFVIRLPQAPLPISG